MGGMQEMRSDHKWSTETHSTATCELKSLSTVCSYTHSLYLDTWYHIWVEPMYTATLLLSRVRNLMYSVLVLLSSFRLVNCLWILNLFMYINSCISLTHFLSLSLSLTHTHTHTAWVSPHLEQIKGLSCFAGLSWGQWVLVLRASFTRSEWSWRRNEKKPYISRCCRVKEVLLAYNAFLDSFLHHYRDTPLALYLAHLLHSCLLSKKMDNSLLGAFWIINSTAHR